MLLVRHGVESHSSVINARDFNVPASTAPCIVCDGGSIEIVGRSGVGKSQLALASLLPLILPTSWDGVTLDGTNADGCALWIDCRSRPKYDVAVRVSAMVRSAFAGKTVSAESLARLTARSTARIHYARVNTATALLCALIQAERMAEERNAPADAAPLIIGEYLRESHKRPRSQREQDGGIMRHAAAFNADSQPPPQQPSPSPSLPPSPPPPPLPLRAVVVDDVAAFFWPLRDGEQTQRNRMSTTASADGGDRPLLPLSSSSYYSALASIAERIERRFGTAVILTKSVIFAAETSGDFLPQTFSRIVGHRIALTATSDTPNVVAAKYSRVQPTAASSAATTSTAISSSWARTFCLDASGLTWC